MSLELRLILICARIRADAQANAEIRKILVEEIDWTLLVQKALDHGVTGLVGHALARAAADIVPDDILKAFKVNRERTRVRNRALFSELVRVITALERNDIQVIPFKGPVLALDCYGDLAFREFRDLDFLIGYYDIDMTMATLKGLGYERGEKLTDSQTKLIQRIQGQEIVFNGDSGIAIEPHTRLVPIKMALPIDYPGLWRRATRATVDGHAMRTLETEDHLLILAIHGGKEFWWRINWASDVAAFLGAHPDLDWAAIMERAHGQGCQRMILLAASLARIHFRAKIPDAVIEMEKADPEVERMVKRITAGWCSDQLLGPPSNKVLSFDRLRLHDRLLQRVGYVARTWFLPGPEIIAWIALPRGLSFLYIPLKVVHDALVLPLWRLHCITKRVPRNPDQ